MYNCSRSTIRLSHKLYGLEKISQIVFPTNYCYILFGFKGFKVIITGNEKK